MSKKIFSLYWDNVQADILESQKEVFQKLRIPIDQIRLNRKSHGEWMTECLRELGDDDSILFVDIDCIPLDSAIVDEAFQHAANGAIFGPAQTSNHLDPGFIFAAPSFLCVSKRTWDMIGAPDLSPDQSFDVGGRLTHQARLHQVPVHLILPSFCLIPKWHLADKGCYGIGTFYEGRIFHLFESRRDIGWKFAFNRVCRSIVDGRAIDYIGLYGEAHSWRVRLANVCGYLERRANRIHRSISKRLPVSAPRSKASPHSRIRN